MVSNYSKLVNFYHFFSPSSFFPKPVLCVTDYGSFVWCMARGETGISPGGSLCPTYRPKPRLTKNGPYTDQNCQKCPVQNCVKVFILNMQHPIGYHFIVVKKIRSGSVNALLRLR